MSIERRAISAFKWATAAKLVVQIASWAGTLVVVRLLSPEDYGLMAKVSVICAIAGAVAELGLESAIVRFVDMARDDLRKVYGVSLLCGAGISIAIGAAAPLFAWLFHEPRLLWPIVVAASTIFITAVAIVPSGLATRELAFRRLAGIEMASGLTNIGVTLALAWYGAAVWALVIGMLCSSIVRSVALLTLGETVTPRWSLQGIGEQLKFGLTLVSSRVSYFIVVQSDVLIGSAFLSTVEIGQYAVALQLATLPMSKVMGTINQIMLPAISQQQDDPARVQQAVVKSIGLISLLAFPMLWGISAVAPELVRVLFGSKWLDAIPALVILPLIVPVRMVFSVIFTASLARGNRQLDLRNTIANFTLLPLGFFVGAHWGLVGLCCAWLVSVPLAYMVSVPAVLRFLGIPLRTLLGACGAPAVAAALMVLAVAGARVALADHSPFLTLPVLIVVGALAYIGMIGAGSRRHFEIARSFLRAFIRRESPKGV